MGSKYEIDAIKLARTIDIAIEAIKKYPPEEFEDKDIEYFVNGYLQFKTEIEIKNPKQQKKSHLKQSTEEVLTYFQEASGEAVDFFWNKINNENLPYKRENKLAKILKRDRIKNIREYDFIIDVMTSYVQSGMLSHEEIVKLNTLISNFEKLQKK